ncbi:hypothetical protein GCM10010172_77250 [Paractinoplanes ferrugineus]|uniref:S-adenosyl-L-methionine-dependent methyltransferase n=1 Tax=Paractinoplanes ferrugineus TaxID=113564 RepID=A0A919MFI7_9ACTN|nr:hypothetical protein Afe05nite_46390 [Actinoplanes ferrugineus]
MRTRLIDDLVLDAVAAGATRVVLLGAGYDNRAYRLPALATTPVVETDHPATQQAKMRVVKARIRADRRAHVRFGPVDPSRQELPAAALDTAAPTVVTAAPTVVIWEAGPRSSRPPSSTIAQAEVKHAQGQ